MTRFDVAVIGAGVMGTATARHLARSGRNVVLYEQFEVGHNRGSSHGRSRIFRFSYPEAQYVDMAMEARPLWRDLEQEKGEPLVVTLGGLDIGEGIDRNADALEKCGAEYEFIDAAEVTGRFPFMRLGADEQALFQPDAGIVLADRAVAALCRSAVAAGAELREQTRVDELSPTDSGVTVGSDGTDEEVDAVVVTAGAWAKGLLAHVGIELNVNATRETVAYFALDGTTPPTLVEWGRPAVYALPSPNQGIKAGEHIAGPTIDPDETGVPNEDSAGRVREWISRRFPNATRTPHLMETCLYTNTPDENFIVERHGRIVVGSPCSGHGFKFAPLIGKRLAGLASEVLT